MAEQRKKDKKRVAVAGSAGNPISLAHQEFAEILTKSRLFDLVLWFPSGTRSDKPDLISSGHRVRMTELAFNEEWQKKQPTEFCIDLREAHRPSIPTIGILREVQKEYSDAEIVFATGIDVLAPRPEYGGGCDVLRYWVEGESLMRDWTFAVLPREGYPDPKELQKEGKLPIHFLLLPRPSSSIAGISSTEVRRRVKAGESFDGLVHPEVAEYIKKHELYR
ncbi:MAG: nicotinate-nicotinamide nucleotide adenylyltransferase [bacterium]|nr:nicotinate-nicotinamide nucleotide adenylyltransferase [bacterium]